MLLTSSWITDTTILIALIGLLIYKYLTRHFDYWEKRNVPYLKPTLLFGNFKDVFTCKLTIQEHLKNLYDKIDAPYFGVFLMDEPLLILKDPKLFKDVLIKDADVFANRRPPTPTHRLMENSVIFMKYPHWKSVRTRLTPVFTPVMLKNMHVEISEITKSMVQYLFKNKKTIDGRGLGKLFSDELIFKCFFGVNLDSFNEKPTPIGSLVKKMNEFSLRNALVQNLSFIKPSWATLLKLDFFSDSSLRFFEDIFKKGMEARNHYDGKPLNYVDFANKGVRELGEGMNASKEMDMSVAGAILFLIAGRDTLNTLLSFTLYELALHESVQTRLRQEIQENIKKYGGITYEGMQDNKYLDMCIKESMRKYPPIPFVDRVPISDYQFEGSGLKLESDKMTVVIPFLAIHRDEKYFPNPESYDPERFAEETVSEGLIYFPFGEGPRACIGRRLAMLSLSIGLSYVLMNFEIERSPETPTKIEFEPKSFPLISKVGLPIKITPL
ncbi:cytochrome P450 6j1-like [Diabrotica virgifera virgifera]|uniref:Cytochrome P450 6k1-like n=1 Tax=Diabrotica virgifera virgifera TaxID=50390 RepID=A0ABM5KYR4_DIAVI|nr:cytochrome P450 6j1-like [Diabrotica virgifera virgifera]